MAITASGRRNPTRSSGAVTIRGAGRGSSRLDQLAKARDVNMRDVKTSTVATRTSSLVQLRVTGLSKSRAASNTDGGVGALVKFLERRGTIAQNKNAESKGITKRQPVRIRKTKTEGDAAILSVTTEDVKSIISANGYEFSGVNIKIELLAPTGPRSTQFSFNNGVTRHSGASPAKLKETFRSLLARRYDVENKLLDLSAICEDAELKAIGLTSLTNRSNFFPALMKICDDVFPTREQKQENVLFITLKNNDLQDLTPVTSLSQTFPDLKNLDLSGNRLSSMKSISRWQHKFRHLEQIVLTSNPLEKEVPDFKAQLVQWYPNLHTIDMVALPEADLVAARAKKPLPKIQPGRFNDDGGVAETFLKQFFAGYDTDRKGLAEYYYDATSRFSLDVNTHALRDPSQKTQAREWESYIRLSRNLLRINNLGARMKRSHQGTAAVADIFAQLPATRHPDFAVEPEKWLIECQPLACLPDPSGQYPSGVNGLLVIVHGEFDEVDTNKKRSFDRTFTLGPGGPNGVRVVNDLVTIRAYGGIKAFQIDPSPVELINNEAAEQLAMVIELRKQTGLNEEFALMCFREVGFNLVEALAAYERVKPNIPAEAYM